MGDDFGAEPGQIVAGVEYAISILYAPRRPGVGEAAGVEGLADAVEQSGREGAVEAALEIAAGDGAGEEAGGDGLPERQLRDTPQFRREGDEADGRDIAEQTAPPRIPARIGEGERIVRHIAVAVEALRSGAGEGIGLEHAPERRIVEAAVHVDESRPVHMLVAGVAAGGAGRHRSGPLPGDRIAP